MKISDFWLPISEPIVRKNIMDEVCEEGGGSLNNKKKTEIMAGTENQV